MRTEDEMRQAVVFSALFEYHAQKFMRVGNSLRPLRDDKRVAAYWKRVLGPKWKGPPPSAWCAAFALWNIQEAGLAPGVILIVNKVNGEGHGFCEPNHLPHVRLSAGEVPQPGDVAYLDQPYQHHAIVEQVVGADVWTIDGNQPAIDRHGPQGTLPARPLSRASYYSIAPFIQAALRLEAEPQA